jgi:hypothetical protein
MGDNNQFGEMLSLHDAEDPLGSLQQFLSGVREGRSQTADSDGFFSQLHLLLDEYTEEIAAGLVQLFDLCFSKGIKWKTLTLDLPAVANQNEFLHRILSQARRFEQFRKVKVAGENVDHLEGMYLTNDMS